MCRTTDTSRDACSASTRLRRERSETHAIAPAYRATIAGACGSSGPPHSSMVTCSVYTLGMLRAAAHWSAQLCPSRHPCTWTMSGRESAAVAASNASNSRCVTG